MSGPCPSCRGNPREEVDGEVYVCPDCAGTGKAENSISSNERLRDAAPRLADALKQLLDYTLALELVAYDAVEQHDEHPVVAGARAALAAYKAHKRGES